ncbi:hypothetical protein GNP66_19815 [Aliivibrio fischeri]|nr:hypothetical protein [Aliivibrio fischeri]
MDFILINKSIYYILLLLFLPSINLFDGKFFRRLFYLLIICFFVKYVYLHALGNSRPLLFTENNFEVVFLILIYYGNFILNGSKKNKFDITLLALIVFLSGSRSGFVCFIYLFSFLSFSKIDKKTLFKVILLLCATLVAYYLFIERLNGKSIESIDRVVFFNLWYYDWSQISFINKIFGFLESKPLSPYVCNSLIYYSALFSHENSSQCYSVILHAYNLRVLYDFGIVGMLCIYGTIFFLISHKLNRKSAVLIVGVLFLNGLSVSSLSSTIIIFGIFLIYLSDYSIKQNKLLY